MRKLLPILIVILVAVAAFAWVQGSTQAGHLDVYKGLVNVTAGTKTTEGRTGTPVHPLELVKTQSDSRAGVIFRDNTVLRMESDSQVRIAKMSFGGPHIADAQAEIVAGKAWWNVQPLDGGSMTVETPDVVATVRGTRFSVHFLAGVSEVYVSHGKVLVTLKKDPNGNGVLLTDGMFLRVAHGTLDEDFARGPILLNDAMKDEWIRFNEGKDLLLDPGSLLKGVSSSSDSSEASSSSVSSAASSAKSVAKSSVTTAPKSSAAALPSSAAVSSSSRAISSVPSSSRAVSSASSVASVTLKRLELTAERTTMAVNEKQMLFVTAFFSDGSKISPYRDVTWSIEPVGSGFVDSAGAFTKKTGGDTNVTASHADVQSNTVTISAPAAAAAPTVARLAVSCVKNPPPPSVTYVPLPTADCTATAYYSDGSNGAVRPAWSASGTAKGTIDANGHYVTGNAGTDTITAVFGGVTGTTSVTMP